MEKPKIIKPDRAKTGWPPGMLQDDSKEFSKWLASKPEARWLVRRAAAAIGEQT